MTTRCKFRCNQVKQEVSYVPGGGQGLIHSATFIAVVGGSPENEAFFTSTPIGTLTIGTHKAATFEAGKFYFLDITEAAE